MATRQELHLAILNQEYSRFVRDQVLTEGQLNEIIDFFEDQHRLTRISLVGTGIVCGLHLSRSATSVTLTPGVAVTTDGDLLKSAEKNYLYFSRYTPPDNCRYDPFYYLAGNTEKMLTLYQLLTEEEKDALNSSDYQEIKEIDSTIRNWVGILYLEYYTREQVKCTATNCDNLGIRQKATAKVLILSKEDMDKLIHKDTDEPIGDDIYLKYHDAYDQYFTFPVIRAKRVLPDRSNTLQGTTLAGAYYTAVKAGASELGSAIKQLYKTFGFLVDSGDGVNIDKLTKKLTKTLTTPIDTLSAQYMYDFYKDVIAAYNELREGLYNVVSECCPNIYAFPKHIMLGEADVDLGPRPPDYRHQFYPSPAVSKNKTKVNSAISMLHRLQLMVDNFNPGPAEEIRITPSLDYDRDLAERAIPFYYQNIKQLAGEWSYGRSLKGQEKLNLSYNADQYAEPVPDQALNPFAYDVDRFNFFRIEGHIGKDFQTALKELHELRSTRGIPIDLVAVRLGDAKLSDIDLDDFSCQFEDLDAILRAFRAEMTCLLSEGTRFFSGFTASKTAPHINQQLFKASSEQQKWTISDEQLQAIATLNITEEKPGLRRTATESVKNAIEKDISVRAPLDSIRPGSGTLSDMLAETKRSALQTDICDQFNKPVFITKQTVKTEIDRHQESFGKYFLQALATETDSVDDFLEKARKIAGTANALNDLSDDEKHVVFEYPMQIIGDLNYMQRFIPASIAGINTNLIAGYRDFGQTFCKRLKAMHTRLEGHFRTPAYTTLGYESFYLNMLDKLGNLCCGNEKLEVIMEEIEKRKTAILERLSLVRFAEQHPGLEHKCGVHRGGTFVLVYAGAKTVAAKEKVDASASKSELLTASMMKARATAISSPYRDIDTFALYIAANDDTVDAATELAGFLAFNSLRPGSVVAESLTRDLNTRIANIRQILCRDLTEPERDLVIADFCLPYQCCSDCPPTAFVIPRERKILALPTDVSCTTGAPIPFSSYFPKGAVIASPEAARAIVPGDDPAFDPAQVPDAQLGKAITFTLDGEPTSCTIVVLKPLEILVAAEVKDSAGDTFTIIYRNSTSERGSGGNNYAWKFNDGSSEVTQGTAPLTKSFNKKTLREQGINSIIATISVLDDPCNSTGSLELAVPAHTDITCQDLVLEVIAATSKALTLDEFRRRVELINLPAVQRIYEISVRLLEMAAAAVKSGDRVTTAKIIGELAARLKEICTFPLSSSMPPDSPRILEELLRTLLLLLLNLVKCDEDIPAASLENVVGSLKLFIELQNRLKEMYPRLDARDVLQKAIEEYDATFIAQTDTLKRILKAIVEILATFP